MTWTRRRRHFRPRFDQSLTILPERSRGVIEEVLTQHASAQAAPGASAETVEAIGPVEPFVFNWPADYGSEDFTSATAYRLSSLAGEASVVVGWTTRYAWNRDRSRAVVFHRMRPAHGPGRWYPWTEFVETDTGRFGAPIPDPQRPRAILRDGEPLPQRFSGKTVAHADEV